MKNLSPTLMTVVAVLLNGWLGPSPAAAQENGVAPAADKEASTGREPSDAEKERLRVARRHVLRLKMRLGEEGDAVELVEEPLLSFGDAARLNTHGTLWAFGSNGRPDALMELWQVSTVPGVWFQSFIRIGDRPLLLESPEGQRWRPPKGKIIRNVLPDAESPADSRSARLRQLRAAAKRFAAHESGDADHARTELRLLTQPICRYDDREGDLLDGAAFIFAHGTNPEAVLLVEALGSTAGESRWHYSLFPTTSADLHVDLDGKEIWMRPGAPGIAGRPTDDYWLFSLPTEPVSDDAPGPR